jgi:hypothetical protein
MKQETSFNDELAFNLAEGDPEASTCKVCFKKNVTHLLLYTVANV